MLLAALLTPPLIMEGYYMRSREQVIWDFVQQWIGKAEEDLEAARILKQSKLKDYSTCAFHCQQAAEKYLKAFLVRHQIEFRKTHDLEGLLNLCERGSPSILKELSFCTWLTPFGVEYRYPTEYPEVDQQTAQKAVEDAQKVKNAVMKELEGYLSKSRP